MAPSLSLDLLKSQAMKAKFRMKTISQDSKPKCEKASTKKREGFWESMNLKIYLQHFKPENAQGTKKTWVFKKSAQVAISEPTTA